MGDKLSPPPTASIIAVVKTQGSDTKLAGHMQPCYEAKACAQENWPADGSCRWVT